MKKVSDIFWDAANTYLWASREEYLLNQSISKRMGMCRAIDRASWYGDGRVRHKAYYLLYESAPEEWVTQYWLDGFDEETQGIRYMHLMFLHYLSLDEENGQ